MSKTKTTGELTKDNLIHNQCQRIVIQGIRGIPARHGGFETFAELLSLYLVGKGWEVVVYCQEERIGEVEEDQWHGVKRIRIPISKKGPLGTIIFDLKSTIHAIRKKENNILTLGYNTAILFVLFRIAGVKNIVNMDGIEWKRVKWSYWQKLWLYANEKFGCYLGNALIADHPEIKKHLANIVSHRKITVVPYSSEEVVYAEAQLLRKYSLEPGRYALVVARPEPENTILEIVSAYSRKERGRPLVILGEYSPQENSYHKQVVDAAGEEVMFLGALYDTLQVQALRFYCCLYIHGHTVGGTNPSLVEALGAGSAVLAQDNRFNRWVTGDEAVYFSSEEECSEKLDLLLSDNSLVERLKTSSRKQHQRSFSHEKVLGAYENILRSENR